VDITKELPTVIAFCAGYGGIERGLDLAGIEHRVIAYVEIEAFAIANLVKASNFISTLNEIGCSFALDDFGSGMSSFAYLKKLPVDFLKIEGMFVRDISSDPVDFAMVKSINELGHAMGKRTIAEFVESREIMEKLREIGVDYVQGYGIARPEPLV